MITLKVEEYHSAIVPTLFLKEHGKIGYDVHTFALHVYLLRCVVVKLIL